MGVKKPFTTLAFLPYAILVPIGILMQSPLIAVICLAFTYIFNGWSMPGPRAIMLETPGVAGIRAGTAIGLLILSMHLGGAVMPFIYTALAGHFSEPNAMVIVCIAGSLLCVSILSLTKETGMGREAAEKLYQEKKAARLAARNAQN
jgi:sugar phosphate permease